MRVDEALELLGGYGRYQLLAFFVIGLNFMYTPMHIFSDVFTAQEPDHHCRVLLEGNDTLASRIPMSRDYSGHLVYAKCSVYSNDKEHPNITSFCPNGIEYDLTGGPTIVTEWELSCNKSMSVYTTSVHGVAAVLGAVIFSPFADAYGRKALFLMCWWQTGLLALGMVFVNDISSFWVLRFLSRIYTEGAELAMFVLACEFFPVDQRPFAAFALYLFYATGQMLLAFQAYLIRNWRYLQLAISVGVMVLLPFGCFLPESPHWLATWGRRREAERIIRRAAKFNRVSLPPDFRLDVINIEEEEHGEHGEEGSWGNLSATGPPTPRPKASGQTRLHQLHPHLSHFRKLTEYMRNATLRRDFLIAAFLWAVSAYIYYGLTVMPISLKLTDGFYLNYFLGGAVMVPAFSSIFILQKFGRKKPLLVFFAVTGVLMIAYSLTPVYAEDGTHLGVLLMVIKLIAKCSTVAAMVSTRLLVAEIFPTTVRSTCVGLAAFIGFLGGSAGLYFPILKKMSKYTGVAVGCLALVAAFLCNRLPETSNRPLPENIKDLMMQYRNVVQNMLFSQMNGAAQATKRSSADRRISKTKKHSVSGSRRSENGTKGSRKIRWSRGEIRLSTPEASVTNPQVSVISETFASYDNPSFVRDTEDTITKL